MPIVTSKDGTTIGYDRKGYGPAIILVAGATQYRAIDPNTPLMADQLAERFTVVNYDRRGRGESTDTTPYAVAREIEDIAALVDASAAELIAKPFDKARMEI
jgi:pimeloyl-ACP methyl ester carboxylesterase